MKMEYKMQDTYLSVEASTLPSTQLPRICLIFWNILVIFVVRKTSTNESIENWFMYYYTIIKLIVTKKKEKLNDTTVLKYLSTYKV